MASGTPVLSYEIGAIFAAAMILIGIVYAFNRYMKRRGGELAAREGRSVLDDRAFNQIRIGKAAADRLVRSGSDVSSAQVLLGRAETARQSGAYDQAIELAKKAQDLLAAARTGSASLPGSPTPRVASAPVTAPPSARPSTVPPPFGSPPRSAPAVPFTSDPISVPAESPELAPAPSNRPPKNKMEAHFQLSLATEEIERVRSSKPGTKSLREATRLRAEGQTAYDRQDFTEALRLALRSRRTLGTRVETLPVYTVASGGAVSSAPSDPTTADVKGPSGPLPAASGPTCPQCGRVSSIEDRFCRGCGGPLAPSLCATCGAPLRPGDRFCASCGTVLT